MNETRRILDLAVFAGKIMLSSGAEIFRVEETMTRIVNAYGVEDFDIFIITNGIFAIVEKDGEQICTKIKHIPTVSIHLGKVAEVNNLSRNIVAGKYTTNEAYEELRVIEQLPSAPYKYRILAAGVGSACFSYILGGTFFDGGVAFLIGMILYVFIIYAEKHSFIKVISNIMGSGIVTISAIMLYNMGLGNNIDKIIIGGIIPLVPGVAFTNGIRNIIDGDYLSGVILLLDAILVAVCIAIGVGVVLKKYTPGV